MARLNTVKSFRGTSKTKDGKLTCESCSNKISKGDSYRWWANKMGRSSHKHVRCDRSECYPKPWEYQTTSPHIAGLMMAEDSGQRAVADVALDHDDLESFCTDVMATAQEMAESIREVGEGYREGAQNMEDGFGHPTYQSEELSEKSEQLDGQAEELESWEPDNTEPPEREESEDDKAYAETLEQWAEGIRDEANDAISDGCQVP